VDSKDIARLLALAGLWGGSFAFMRVAAPALGPFWLAFLRTTLAFAALLALALALARGRLPPLRARWRDYLAIGVLNSALPFALFSFAAQHASASNLAVLNAMSPFFGALVAALWLRQPLGLRQLGGMLLGLVGVALLVGLRTDAMSATALAAILAALAAAACYGLASVYTRARMADLPSASIALYSQLTAAVVLAPTLAFTPLPTPPGALVVANVLALAIASTALGYLLYFRLIATIGPTRALTVTFLIPAFGVLWGVLFLDEPLAANTLSACALILAGTWLATRPASRRTAPRGA
jgi:drug/metabolite transporter (DMT)-like permease